MSPNARLATHRAYRDAASALALTLAEAERAASIPDLPQDTREWCDARLVALQRIVAGLEQRAKEHEP